jgi:hypothetical protein
MKLVRLCVVLSTLVFRPRSEVSYFRQHSGLKHTLIFASPVTWANTWIPQGSAKYEYDTFIHNTAFAILLRP